MWVFLSSVFSSPFHLPGSSCIYLKDIQTSLSFIHIALHIQVRIVLTLLSTTLQSAVRTSTTSSLLFIHIHQSWNVSQIQKINLQKPPCKLQGFYSVYNPGYRVQTFRLIILSNLGTHFEKPKGIIFHTILKIQTQFSCIPVLQFWICRMCPHNAPFSSRPSSK